MTAYYGKFYYFSVGTKIAAIISSLVLIFGATPVAAQPNLSNATLTTPGTNRSLLLPSSAETSPVISLGGAVDPQTGKQVEGYAIIHFKPGYSHKPNHRQGGTACYGYLGQNTKWKVVEPWIVNPINSKNLDGEFVFNNLSSDIAKWEDAADGALGNGVASDILGEGSSSTESALLADTVSPDGANEVYFADVSSLGAIAVTIVWGVFSGPPFARELVEWDQVYDDFDFDWSSSGELGKMDFENIATHELGHSIGLADLYDLACMEETMYGYADNGEVKKRDLNSGDIQGTNKLY